ncbi:MAG: hypothetical protein ACFFBE_16755 [Promethearchaeota archaeon]
MKKKELIKINRVKLAPKLTLVILLITVITGFACTFATANENQRSTRYDFEAEVKEIYRVPIGLPWIDEDGVIHMRFYKENELISGTIDEEPIVALRTEETFHMKIDPNTGIIIVNGKGTFYIEWNGLIGSFSGTIKVMIVNGIMSGKYTMQGVGDFEGMKLFGTVRLISGGVNGLSGTILIPN